MSAKTRYFMALISLLAVSATSIALATSSNPFRVCADPNNPPFSDKNGNGFENKIATLLAKRLGEKVEYTWFPQRLGFIRNTLKAKMENEDRYKCDVVMGIPTNAELAATTKTYYQSTYALVYVQNRWRDLAKPEDIQQLDTAGKSQLKIAIFEQTPGANWLLKLGLIDQAKPFPLMPGDARVSQAELLLSEFTAGDINMAIVWGPIAGYLVQHSKKVKLALLPLQSDAQIRFHFPVSMGVRFPDKERKAQLNELIDKHSEEIRTILQRYGVPLVDDKGTLLP